MKVIVKEPIEKAFKYLIATVGVRYWSDCTISTDAGKTWKNFEDNDRGEEDAKKLLPFVSEDNIGYGFHDYWCLTIDLDEGKVVDWPRGLMVSTWFKVCDDGNYSFLDENYNEIINITDKYDQYYVPKFFELEDCGYGDYVFIDIDETGKIKHFDLMQERINEYFENIE